MEVTQAGNRHYHQLDSVRGIAALVVCLAHAAHVYQMPAWFRPAFDSIANSHGAVVLFFILSGFVLGLSWRRYESNAVGLLKFYVRRGFRIVPALWVATTLAVLSLALFPPVLDAPFSEWFVRFNHDLSAREVMFGYLVLDNEALPPVWTIYVELVGSLAIPPLVWLLLRGRAPALATIAALAALSFPASLLPNAFWPAVYMVDFAIGIALAYYLPKLSRQQAVITLLAGLAFITVGRAVYFFILTGEWQDGSFGFNDAGAALVEAIGGTLLIASLVSGQIGTGWAQWRPIRALGHWSYSFYLVHFAVMRTIANGFPVQDPVVGTIVLMAATVVISAALSWAIYWLVEMPGIKLGKFVTRSWTGKTQPVAGA